MNFWQLLAWSMNHHPEDWKAYAPHHLHHVSGLIINAQTLKVGQNRPRYFSQDRRLLKIAVNNLTLTLMVKELYGT